MSTIQFQCTLSTPNNKPLYKTYPGIWKTYIALMADIYANVQAMYELGIHISYYKSPCLHDIMRCWVTDKELVYTIHCEDSQYNVEFRLTPKHIEQ